MNEESSLERGDDRRKRLGCGQTLIIVVAGLVLLCLLAGGLSALSNNGLACDIYRSILCF
jgi:hypothetical protein